MKRIIVTGPSILYERKWVKAKALVIDNGIISAIIPKSLIKQYMPATLYEFEDDHYLVPGFIDLHIHGADGCDVMDGDPEGLSKISHALAREGVTGFLATTLSAEQETLEYVLKMIVDTAPKVTGAALLGIHLEGPFIAPEKVGAHDFRMIEKPEPYLIKKWQSIAQGSIKIITLAPELPEALELIHTANKLNILVSMGHTNATLTEALAAIEAGVSQVTHLFNAMRGLHHREPGVIAAALLADKISVELIMDGLHLHPAIAELVLRMKGRERILLVTDAIRAKCMRDGEYQLGNRLVKVKFGKATLSDGKLAGSTLTMPRAIANMKRHSKCSLIDAILMATENPATVLGMINRKGSIEKEKDADLVVLTPNLEVIMTMRAGREVFKKYETVIA